MVANSGLFPYNLEGPQPFVIDTLGTGFSGVLFEQAMWVALAEWRRYFAITSGTNHPFVFRLYQNLSGTPGIGLPYPDIYDVGNNSYGFEPVSSGTTLSSSGNIGTINWITDLRAALSGVEISGVSQDPPQNNVWGLAGLDSDLPVYSGFSNIISADEVPYAQVWLKALANKVGTEFSPNVHSNVAGDRHFYQKVYPGNDAAPSGYLGGSGIILDLDLREVMYHPIPRFSKFAVNRMGEITGPIYPAFCGPNGEMVAVNSFEASLVPSGNLGAVYSKRAAASGYITIDGDVLVSSEIGTGTKITFGNGVEKFILASGSESRRFINGRDRSFINNTLNAFAENRYFMETDIPISRGFIDPPTGTEESFVTASVSNQNCPVPSSLEVSVYPLRNVKPFVGRIDNPSKVIYDMQTIIPCSGFHFISDGLWIGHPNFIVDAIEGKRYAGIGLISSVATSLFSWIRLDPNEVTEHLGGLVSSETNSISESIFAHREGSSILHIHTPTYNPIFNIGNKNGRAVTASLDLSSPSESEILPSTVDNAPSGNGTTEVRSPSIGIIYNGDLWDSTERDIGSDILYSRSLGGTTISPYAISSLERYSKIFEVSAGEGEGIGIQVIRNGDFQGMAVVSGFIPNGDPFDTVAESVGHTTPTTGVTDNTGYGFTEIRIDATRSVTGFSNVTAGLWAIGTIGVSGFAETNFLGRVTIGISGEDTNITLEELHPFTFGEYFLDPQNYGESDIRRNILIPISID